MSFVVRMTGAGLTEAYNAVRNGDMLNDWALYTYKEGSSDLIVQETGDGGLEVLCERFSPALVQHAYARVEDPRMHGDKFILIHWCGDDAPTLPRRFFAVNCGRVANFLRGASVTITGNDESDIRPSEIMKKLVGHGSAGDFPRAPPQGNLFRRSTMPSPQRSGSLYEPARIDTKLTTSPLRKPMGLADPSPVSNPFDSPLSPSTGPSAGFARPTPVRGATSWGEKQAAKRRQETLDEKRAAQLYGDQPNRGSNTSTPQPQLQPSWSSRPLQRASSPRVSREEELRLEAEAELAAKDRELQELEAEVKRKQEELEMQMALQEEEERALLEQEEMEQEEARRWEDDQRQREKRRELDRLERERQLELEHQAELIRLEEERRAREDKERLRAQLEETRRQKEEAEREREALRIQAAESERRARELAEERRRREEDEHKALLKREAEVRRQREMEEAARKLAEEEEMRKLVREDERRKAEQRAQALLQATEVQRLNQRIRELELRNEAARLKEETFKLREEQQILQRKNAEKQHQLEREREERVYQRQLQEEEQAQREDEERLHQAEIEGMKRRAKELEQVARTENAAKEKATAAEKDLRRRLRETEERSAKLEADRAALLMRQQKIEQQKLEQQRKKANLEKAGGTVDLGEPVESEEPTLVVEPVASNVQEKKRRVLVPRPQAGWGPISTNTGFSFDRAARSILGGESSMEVSLVKGGPLVAVEVIHTSSRTVPILEMAGLRLQT